MKDSLERNRKTGGLQTYPCKWTYNYLQNKRKGRRTHELARTKAHRLAYTHTFGGCAPDILQSTMGAGETVMDYRHIWAVISRSHIPPAFSRRQKSCIMVSC